MRWLFFVLSVVMLGVVGCGASQQASHADPLVSGGTFTLEELREARGERPFEGDFGGVTFKRTVSAEDLGCPSTSEANDVATETVSSPLIFNADFLMPEYILFGEDSVNVCGDRPISFSIDALAGDDSYDKELIISRTAGTAVEASEPEEAFREVQVGGKPAVLIQRPPILDRPREDDPYNWRLVIKEAFGVTSIESYGLTREEVLAVAEKLQ